MNALNKSLGSTSAGGRGSHLNTKIIPCVIVFLALGTTSSSADDLQPPYRTFKKSDQIVLDVGSQGKFDSTQAKYPCILPVGDELWMWYNGRTDDRFTGSIGLATSKDGLSWTKQNDGNPVFEHGPPGTFDATKADHPAVLRFDGKFHMWYTAGDQNSRYTIGYATSDDGHHWTRQNDGHEVFGPGTQGKFDDQVVLHPAVVRDDSGLLHLWYNGVGPQQTFCVGHATSRDGISWQRRNNGDAVLEPSDVGDFSEGYVYNVFVRIDNGHFHMWYSAWGQPDRKSGPNHSGIMHAVSSNGDQWTKDATPTLTNGSAGSIDQYACFACCVLERGGDDWMYYSAGAHKTDGPYRVALAISRSPEQRLGRQSENKLFRQQWHKPDLSFCIAQVGVDFDGDGRRELLFASRETKQLQMLDAASGRVVWSRTLAGDQQSIAAYDLDGDEDFEILYSVSGPGRLYVLDHAGTVLRQWDAGDNKLGNSAVILDADGDGQLDGLLGSRYKYLLRLNMTDLTLAQSRDGWVQCGCQTTAMDVDRDGRWDLFAGSGDDSNGKGVLHRYDPVTLQSVWEFKTNDNASSADPVLVDIDDDGQVEILKSVDNYAGDDAHDAIYALETDGTLLWKTPGFAGEDSPNAADLNGDGQVEIVGMTFGGEVYCLDAQGRVRWRTDLRPELSDSDAHAYLTPILCDLDGDQEMEILALTNGGFFDASGRPSKNRVAGPGIVFALSADGQILDRFDVGGPRYWGGAFVCNVDEDPALELVVAGSGGVDVIETNGVGPNTEHFQRRRNYQRLNVVPWAYEDSYFIYRGTRAGVVNRTDNLVLLKSDRGYSATGTFTTELFTLPPGANFDRISYQTRTPAGTSIRLTILDARGKTLRDNVQSGEQLALDVPIKLRFELNTTDAHVTPTLDEYKLRFRN